MSMKELVDAAVASAARSGIQAAVVIVDGGSSNGAHSPAAPNQELIAAKHQVGELVAQRDQLARELEAARAAQVPSTASPALVQDLEASRQRVAALEAKLAESPMQSDALQRIAELEAALAEAQEARQSVGPGDTEKQGGDPGDAMLASFLNEPLKVLGAEDKVEKGLTKAGCQTIGQVRERYLNDTDALKKEGRLTKDDLIRIGVLLAGRAPSLDHAKTSTNGGAAHAPPAPTGLPAGVVDRPWSDRLDAARSKEDRMQVVQQGIDELRQKAKTEHADALTADGQIDIEKLRVVNPTLANQITAEEKTFDIVRGQKIAMMWSCALPVNVSIDEALKEKGVSTPASAN